MSQKTFTTKTEKCFEGRGRNKNICFVRCKYNRTIEIETICFRKNKIHFKDTQSLGVSYDFKKSLMASKICEIWVQNLEKFITVGDRKIIFLVELLYWSQTRSRIIELHLRASNSMLSYRLQLCVANQQML